MPQFLHATKSEVWGEVDGCFAEELGGLEIAVGAASRLARSCLGVEFELACLAILLLKAGHPPQPSAPPAPLQLPPPGQEPGGCSGSR